VSSEPWFSYIIFSCLIIKLELLDRTQNDTISMNGRYKLLQESNLTVSSHAGRSITSYILFEHCCRLVSERISQP